MQMYDRMRQPVKLERQVWFYDAESLAARMRTFVSSLFDRVRLQNPGVQIISEKTPSNIAVAQSLLELFPDSRFICVQRDGRDVLFSHKKVRERFLKEHGGNALPWMEDFRTSVVCGHWKTNAEQARKVEQLASQNVRERFLTLRYEDLAAQPVAAVERICQFVGISPEPLMLTPEKVDPTETGQITNIDNVWYTKAQFSQEFNTQSIGSWRSGLSPLDRCSANLRMAPELIRLGYDVPPFYRIVRNVLDRLRGRS